MQKIWGSTVERYEIITLNIKNFNQVGRILSINLMWCGKTFKDALLWGVSHCILQGALKIQISDWCGLPTNERSKRWILWVTKLAGILSQTYIHFTSTAYNLWDDGAAGCKWKSVTKTLCITCAVSKTRICMYPLFSPSEFHCLHLQSSSI